MCFQGDVVPYGLVCELFSASRFVISETLFIPGKFHTDERSNEPASARGAQCDAGFLWAGVSLWRAPTLRGRIHMTHDPRLAHKWAKGAEFTRLCCAPRGKRSVNGSQRLLQIKVDDSDKTKQL